MTLTQFILSGGYLVAPNQLVHPDCPDWKHYAMKIERDIEIDPSDTPEEQHKKAYTLDWRRKIGLEK